jgi:3',5'-nucleoside bisphosphate phosphatase
VLPGMELQTREEVHVLCLFDTPEQMAAWQATVDALLPHVENNAEFFGDQFIVDDMGEFVQRETRLLLTSADLTLQEAVEGVQKLGGMAIPAHINRKAFGLIENLGLIPEDVPFDALEISRHLSLADARRQIFRLDAYPVVQGGDVHRLDEFLGRNLFRMEAPTMSEMRRALRNEDGRTFNLRSVRTS